MCDGPMDPMLKMIWDRWPRKEREKAARKWWDKHKPDLLLYERIVESAEVWIVKWEIETAMATGDQHPPRSPFLSAWLSGERWNDLPLTGNWDLRLMRLIARTWMRLPILDQKPEWRGYIEQADAEEAAAQGDAATEDDHPPPDPKPPGRRPRCAQQVDVALRLLADSEAAGHE